MPKVKFTVHSSQLTVKKLIVATSYLLLATILSGCTVLGATKPSALQVTSTPESSIFLDGKHLGKTPFFSDQLKAGEYTLKITASEAAHVEKISLNEGTLTVLNRELHNNFLAQSGETLWLDSSKKGLLVVSMPGEADLTIDGAQAGKTPYSTEDLKDGEHKVTIGKNGYAEREFTIKTSGKYQLVADVTLASLSVKTNGDQSESTSPAVKKLEVTKTPQGFLRVRADASLSAPEIGRVKTGDQLEIVQEIKDWVKVNFEGKQGWISAQYTKKL